MIIISYFYIDYTYLLPILTYTYTPRGKHYRDMNGQSFEIFRLYPLFYIRGIDHFL